MTHHTCPVRMHTHGVVQQHGMDYAQHGRCAFCGAIMQGGVHPPYVPPQHKVWEPAFEVEPAEDDFGVAAPGSTQPEGEE